MQILPLAHISLFALFIPFTRGAARAISSGHLLFTPTLLHLECVRVGGKISHGQVCFSRSYNFSWDACGWYAVIYCFIKLAWSTWERYRNYRTFITDFSPFFRWINLSGRHVSLVSFYVESLLSRNAACSFY